MSVVKFSISDEWMARLEKEAAQANMTVQDYVRYKLFGGAETVPQTIFTPEEAVRRALEKYDPGDYFTIPELYDEEWTLTRETGAGIFGRKFYDYTKGRTDIEWVRRKGRHAQYKIV